MALVVLAILASACGQATPSPIVAPSDQPVDSGPPDPGAVVVDQIGGAWRRAPIQLADPQVAIASDACAAAARAELGDEEANLPTAVIDARGGTFATAILADEDMAIVCLARFAADGASAAVDSVARLSSSVLEPQDGAHLTVDEVVHLDDVTGGRTVAFGRVGPDGAAVKLMFDDGLVHTAADANGWWSMWWPGHDRSSGFSAVDSRNLVIGSAQPPKGEVESRVSPASWWLDPGAPAPTADSTTVRILVQEQVCASARSPKGRIEPPVVDVAATSITATYTIRRLAGGQDCPANAPFPFVLELPEALGNRVLLDGGETPPRDASKPPAG